MTGLSASAFVAAERVLNEETVRPGLIGLVFFVALAVATYFLWRSLNKHIKRADDYFAEVDGIDGPEDSDSVDIDPDDARRDAE